MNKAIKLQDVTAKSQIKDCCAVLEDLKDDAKEYFGTTINPKLCFYINTDGTMLDGSGKKLGSDGKYRQVDHREISDAFSHNIDGNTAMIQYMNEGNIRFMPEICGFDLIKRPTPEQYETMSKITRRLYEPFTVDISDENGDVIWTLEYDRPTQMMKLDLEDYFDTGKLSQYYESLRKHKLQEATRTQLTAASRNVDSYKNTAHGKNRFERKRLSKVATTVKQYNTINMNELFKQDVLTVTIPVIGESDTYNVTLSMSGVVAEIAKNIKSNNNIFEYKTVVQALTKIFNTADIKVDCTCADFKYRYLHNLIINNNAVKDTSEDPGPGSTGITAAMKGQGCKHVLLVLSNMDFLMKVASVIKNYITWLSINKKAVFLKLVFPKLYGTTADAADEANLIPEDTKLESSPDIIKTINEWARNRGKYMKGSNINPVQADKLEAEQKQDK